MPTKSTAAPKKTKPAKPSPEFPLFPHDSGQWARKVRGKFFYFGVWDDPQAALNRWLDEKDYLLAGRTPPKHDPNALTVESLCFRFLQSRERRVETGELAQRTFDDYLETAEVVANHLGRKTPVEHLNPDDFGALRAALAKGRNLKSLEGHIARARAIFNHADKNGLVERSLKRLWGTEFAKPSKKALDKLASQTERKFTAAEVRKLFYASSGQLRAMIALGINGGIGPTDLAMIRVGNIDGDILTLPRNKTGKPRTVPLWPETLQAIKESQRRRPKAKDPADSDLLFLTKFGRSWLPSKKHNPLSYEFRKLAKAAGVHAKGKTFYTLRHTLQQIGDETLDFVAVQSLMGHQSQEISGTYRGRTGVDRLRAVTDHVHDWLFPRPTVLVEGGAK